MEEEERGRKRKRAELWGEQEVNYTKKFVACSE
jgi:hypothetical protein